MNEGLTPGDNREEFNPQLNPDYGTGIFRRRIKLSAKGNIVFAELEDCAHGFRARLEHDGECITSIVGESLRTPYDICKGATEPIKQFIGQPINLSLMTLNQNINARSNCTHLYDLSALALEFCHLSANGEVRSRIIDVVIPDETEKPTDAHVKVDGEEVLAWQLHAWQIVGPDAVAQKPFYRGFAAWVNEELSGLEKTAAFALQKGYLVAESRRYDMDAIAGQSPEVDIAMQGFCYTYSRDNISNATRLSGTMRDFTDCEEQLLTFK